MKNTIEDISMNHLMAFGNNDMEQILADYTEESVILTIHGAISGLSAIRMFFEDFFAAIPTGSAFGMDQKIIVGNIAYIAWHSESNTTKFQLGTDTFVFEEGKIIYHTEADYRIKK